MADPECPIGGGGGSTQIFGILRTFYIVIPNIIAKIYINSQLIKYYRLENKLLQQYPQVWSNAVDVNEMNIHLVNDANNGVKNYSFFLSTG